MRKTFTSPQTGSEYRVIAEYPEQEALVAFRYLEEDSYRVRVQGTETFLQTVLGYLRGWSHIKDGDHISIVVSVDDLRVAISEVLQAVGDVVSYIASSGLVRENVDEDEDEDVGEDEDEDEDDYFYRTEEY